MLSSQHLSWSNQQGLIIRFCSQDYGGCHNRGLATSGFSPHHAVTGRVASKIRQNVLDRLNLLLRKLKWQGFTEFHPESLPVIPCAVLFDCSNLADWHACEYACRTTPGTPCAYALWSIPLRRLAGASF